MPVPRRRNVYCEETARAAAEALGILADSVALGSTGEIGRQLPIDRMKAGVKALAEKKNDSIENGTLAAKAIMTTDTVEKELAAEIEVGGVTVTIGGNGKRFRNDSSEYVHDVKLHYHRRSDFQRGASEGAEFGCAGYL